MDDYIGSIMPWPAKTIPHGWALCDGSILNAAENQALFSVLGGRFGGNGTTTFALPDLRGRTPRGVGQPPGGAVTNMGDIGGQTTVTLEASNLPNHNHKLAVSNQTGNGTAFGNVILAAVGTAANTPTPPNIYSTDKQALASFAGNCIAPSGSGQPHDNMQPYLVLNYIICVFGKYPDRP